MRQALAMAVLAVFSMFIALSAAGMGLFLYQAFKAWRQERRRLRIKRAHESWAAFDKACHDAVGASRESSTPLTYRRRQ